MGMVILLGCFTLVYAWCMAVETSLLELNINKIKFAAEDGDERAASIYEYLQKIEHHISSLQFLIIFSCIGAGITSQILFYERLASFISLGSDTAAQSRAVSVIIVALAMSAALMFIGVLIPKKIGEKYSDSIVYSTMKAVSLLSVVLYPFISVISFIANIFGRIFKINKNKEDENVTEEEIRLLVDAGEDTGAIDETEKEMINNIFEFDTKLAGEIATHRTDIAAIPSDSTLEEILEFIKEEKFSRIPVYNENIDDIIGVFRVRDLLKFFSEKEKINFDIKKILMEPYFVPFSKKVDELFEDMQNNKIQMAIVIDEYGGTEGIVTMEDLIEEIVGNIFDEKDIEEVEIRNIGENIYLIKGTTSLEEVEEMLDVEFENHDDFDTIGGFLISCLGRIPSAKEKPKIHVGNIMFKIERMDDKRIDLIKAFVSSEK